MGIRTSSEMRLLASKMYDIQQFVRQTSFALQKYLLSPVIAFTVYYHIGAAAKMADSFLCKAQSTKKSVERGIAVSLILL